MAIQLSNAQTTNLSLSINQNNTALVSETRAIPKVKNIKAIEYQNISKYIDESSLFFTPITPREVDFNYKCCNKPTDTSVECTSCNPLIPISFNLSCDLSKSDYINVYYLTKEISWNSNYIITLEPKTLTIQCWFNINNRSGLDYYDASLKLIAGDINTPNPTPPMLGKVFYATAQESQNVPAEELLDYYIYPLKETFTLKNNTTKKINNFTINNVKYTTTYDFSYFNNNPNIIITFNNNEANNLGIPLPLGIANVYTTSNCALEYLGGSTINNIPKDETVSLNIGRAFDITATRNIIDKYKDNDYEVKEIQLIIKNGKSEEITSKICYQIYGPYEITSSSDPYTLDKNGAPCFSVKVKAECKKAIVFTYKVKI